MMRRLRIPQVSAVVHAVGVARVPVLTDRGLRRVHAATDPTRLRRWQADRRPLEKAGLKRKPLRLRRPSRVLVHELVVKSWLPTPIVVDRSLRTVTPHEVIGLRVRCRRTMAPAGNLICDVPPGTVVDDFALGDDHLVRRFSHPLLVNDSLDSLCQPVGTQPCRESCLYLMEVHSSEPGPERPLKMDHEVVPAGDRPSKPRRNTILRCLSQILA